MNGVTTGASGRRTAANGGQARLSPRRPRARAGRHRVADDSGRGARRADPARRRRPARRLAYRALPPFRRQGGAARPGRVRGVQTLSRRAGPGRRRGREKRRRSDAGDGRGLRAVRPLAPLALPDDVQRRADRGERLPRPAAAWRGRVQCPARCDPPRSGAGTDPIGRPGRARRDDVGVEPRDRDFGDGQAAAVHIEARRARRQRLDAARPGAPPKIGLLHCASMTRAVLVAVAAVCLATRAPLLAASIDADLKALAALPGEPRLVSAAGITRNETPLLTIENPAPFDAAAKKRRLVIVGGLDGDPRSAQAAIEAVRWVKHGAPKRIRDGWIVSALPMADPDGGARTRPFHFPPTKGFYEDPEQPESRYVWRWVTYQAPDLVIEFRADIAGGGTDDSLGAALRGAGAAGLGPTATGLLPSTATHDDLALALARATAGEPSPLRAAMTRRIARSPLEIARLLAPRYPAAPSISYIPALAWIKTLELSAQIKDEALRTRVLGQIQPWLSGDKPLLGDRIQLTTVAGTMVFAELAVADPANAAARRLALEGADAALKQKDNGIPQYGQGWTDDMFMASAILARSARFEGRGGDLDRAAQLLIAYAGRLQQPDGIFHHATDGPAAWGRGNGFAAFGLMETLTAMDAPRLDPVSAGLAKARSATAESRAALLAIFQKQMKGLAAWQAPDGMWREIIDKPGAYREETATAMILTAMARGVRLGWLDRSFAPVVDRAWRALAAHISEDGGLVDVCTGTGAGPTARYYYDRPAIEGPDDRGGAMALVAAMEMIATR